MNMQNVAIVLSPTMKISHRVLAVLFQNVKILFQNVQIIKYQAPLKPVTSRWSLDMPESPTALVEELSKQEQLLNRLHEQVRRAKDRDKEEQLWEVQRIVTQLKRKMKTIKKVQDLTASKDTPYPVLAVPETIVEQIVEEKEQMGSKEEIAMNIQTQNKDSDDINYDTTLPAIEPDNNTTVNNELEQSQINELLDEVLNLSRENETASELVPELGGVNDYNVTECQEEKLVHNVEYNPLPIIANDFEKIPCNDTHAEFLDTSNVSSINDTLPTSSHVSNSDKCNHPVIAAEDTKMSIKCEKHLVLDSCESILSNNEPVLHLSTKTANLECNHKIINSDVMSDSQSTQVASQHETPLSDTDHHINKWPDDNFTPTKTSFTESPSIDDNDDTEGNFDALEEQYLILLLEEEELLADKSELLKKIEAERHEIERLKLEISEEELVRAEFSDNEISTSDNSSIDEDDDEEELRDMLEQLLVENRRLEKQNEDLGESIHLECHICLDIKVQIRLIQQKHHELITNHNDMYGDCEPLLL